MSTTLVQNSKTPTTNSNPHAVVAATAAAAAAIQQLSSISLMFEYDIDNTLNSIKENGSHISPRKVDLSSNDMSDSAIAITETIINDEINNLKVSELPTPPATPCPENTARKRWKILAKVLRKDSEETVSSSGEENVVEENIASVRRFKSFDLLRQDSFEDHITLNCLGKPENWYKYTILMDDKPDNVKNKQQQQQQQHTQHQKQQQEYSVNIHHLDRQLTATDLMGFNNTGNICVWPSEEALAAYVLSNLPSYRGKWILELGGGFTCLAGLMLSKYAKPFAVHLTDGNEVSVENVKKSICLNELSCYTKCSVLKWEDEDARTPAEAGKFNTILSADCLFFDEVRSHLVDVISFYLSESGEALVMAPKRGKTLEVFVNECRNKNFIVEIIFRYNETIWQRHMELQQSDLYDEDIHYPVLIRLTKRKSPYCSSVSSDSVSSGMDGGIDFCITNGNYLDISSREDFGRKNE